MCSKSNERKQTVQISNSFNSEKSVPQGSIDEPLLFNLFINDLLVSLTETSFINYADDNSLFKMGKHLEFVKVILRKDFKTMTDWFHQNDMVFNQKKISLKYYPSKKQQRGRNIRCNY